MTTYGFLDCVTRSLANLREHDCIDRMVDALETVRNIRGRLFILGNGGGAAHASHAAADFRTLCGIEAYSFDNLANITALANDLGWEHTAMKWLEASQLEHGDALLVISVGGGDPDVKVSTNIVNALGYAKQQRASVLGIVGRDGGYTAAVADECILIPCDDPTLMTPVVEGVQAVLLHLMVADSRLASAKPKWESLECHH